MAGISVLAVATGADAGLAALLRSLDAQTLPVARFELIVAGEGDERLRQYAARRANVRLVPDAASPLELVDAAAGEYVLSVGDGQRLTPRALELLLDTAVRTGADVVLGRTVSGASSGCSTLPEDADHAAAVDHSHCVAAFRGGLARDGLLPRIGPDTAVAVLGRYACAVTDEPLAPDGAAVPARVRWVEGTLHVTATLPDRHVGRRAWLVAVQGPSEVAVPAAVAGGTAEAALDPLAAACGLPLDDGVWLLRLRIAGPEGERTIALSVDAQQGAVVDGRPCVAASADGAAVLDVGARRTNLLGRVAPADASIAETVRGTVATLVIRDLHVRGDTAIDARILLDRFALPARLVCTAGDARIEAYLGALAGVSPVSLQLGGGPPRRTGLRLRVDGAGAMTFETVPPRVPAPQRAPRLAQRLRRRLPGALDPVAQRLAAVAPLRRVYRTLISRSARPARSRRRGSG